MLCPYCKSPNVVKVLVHITKPIGAKKSKCLQCKQTFITYIEQK